MTNEEAIAELKAMMNTRYELPADKALAMAIAALEETTWRPMSTAPLGTIDLWFNENGKDEVEAASWHTGDRVFVLRLEGDPCVFLKDCKGWRPRPVPPTEAPKP